MLPVNVFYSVFVLGPHKSGRKEVRVDGGRSKRGTLTLESGVTS